MKYFRVQHGRFVEITEERFNKIVSEYEVSVWSTNDAWYCK